MELPEPETTPATQRVEAGLALVENAQTANVFRVLPPFGQGQKSHWAASGLWTGKVAVAFCSTGQGPEGTGHGMTASAMVPVGMNALLVPRCTRCGVLVHSVCRSRAPHADLAAPLD